MRRCMINSDTVHNSKRSGFNTNWSINNNNNSFLIMKWMIITAFFPRFYYYCTGLFWFIGSHSEVYTCTGSKSCIHKKYKKLVTIFYLSIQTGQPFVYTCWHCFNIKFIPEQCSVIFVLGIHYRDDSCSMITNFMSTRSVSTFATLKHNFIQI